MTNKEKKRKMHNKGMSAVVRGLIILLVSFAVILFFIFRLNLGEESNKEICHNSVLLKDKSEGFVGSLDCRTNYVCISGGSDCASLDSSSNVDVDASDKEQVMKVLADEMSDCWWQFGEGKVDYTGAISDISAFEKFSCGVCSVVSFDSKVQKNTKITYQEFYDYLRTTKKTESQTYLQYLYSKNDLISFSQGFNPNDYMSNSLEFGNQYVIVTGAIGKGILSFDFRFWTPEFWWGASEKGASPQPVVILEKTQENYQKLGCTDFITKA